MRYIRFESQEPLARSSRLGIFQIAYRVRDAHSTRLEDANGIARLLDWMEDHLEEPDDIDRRANRRAVCWFTPAAHEPLGRIWALKVLVESYGYWISVRKTRDPGNIVYADDWQVAAIPSRRPRPRPRW